MLLDEPTNNLDLPALIWLEDFLKKTNTAFIVVSHDRKFLDSVTNKIFEILFVHVFKVFRYRRQISIAKLDLFIGKHGTA
jgi:ATPase subunit of ABC transporter with duplicated ATPase domains